MKITLPKKFEMKRKDYPFVYNENWISNGHFMVRKESVKDCFKYCLPDERAQINCDRIYPEKTDSDWEKTDIIYDAGDVGYLRVFKCKESNKTVCFKDEYINHFDIKSMKGNSEELMSPFVSSDGVVVLMPCRNYKTDLN